MPNRKKQAKRSRSDGVMRIKIRGKGSGDSRIKKGLLEEAFFKIFAYQPKPVSLTQSEILSPEKCSYKPAATSNVMSAATVAGQDSNVYRLTDRMGAATSVCLAGISREPT